MKILFQADDYGITYGSTYGVLHGIEHGVLRNTGLFVNMPSSEYAASRIKDFPECCFGIDINLVCGKPVSNPKLVPHLVDENGYFISSKKQFELHKSVPSKPGEMGIGKSFADDPYPYDEVLVEMQAQIEKFIAMVGHKPEYLHPHSLITPNIEKAFGVCAEKYGLKLSMEILFKSDYHMPGMLLGKELAQGKNSDNPKDSDTYEVQVAQNVEELMMSVMDSTLEHEISICVGHAGFVDADIFDVSSLTIQRCKDLQFLTSERLIKFVEDHGVELLTYRDL